MNEEIEVKIAALSILAAPYATLNHTLREEFPKALTVRYGLSRDQQDWCAELLADEESLKRDISILYTEMAGENQSGCQFLWDVVDWFLDEIPAKERLLEELGVLGYLPEVGQKLFSSNLLGDFNLIGLPPTFDKTAVVKTFYRTMRLIHPDPAQAAGLTDEEVKRAENLSKDTIEARKRIIEFYQTYRVS